MFYNLQIHRIKSYSTFKIIALRANTQFDAVSLINIHTQKTQQELF